MNNILTIAAREIKSNFVTPTGYVLIAGFMLLSGFFSFTLLQQFNDFLQQAAMMPNVTPNLNEWVISPHYQTLQVVLIFLVPLLTMRAIAEERRSGTFEMLVTAPLKVSEIVFGKFLALAFVATVMLLAAAVFTFVLLLLADPEVMPVLVGLLGMFLFTLSFVAIGLAVSAFTESQMVAGVASLVLLLVFYVIDAPAKYFSDGWAGRFFKYLAPSAHADAMLKGVLQGSDVVYFVSVIAFGLFIANRVMEAQRWR